MRPEQAERVAEIVERALEVEIGQRGQLIVDLCGDDQDLFVEVASLLQFEEKARDFIEAPAVEKVAEVLAGGVSELKAGEVLGDYKIEKLIGEGGMGEVYLAEDTKLGRKVAIKLIKQGFGTASFLRHFQNEEKILAGLNHPNIARLYGASVTAAGIPYFVMEYVDGPRLDHYCRDNKLSIQDRLGLFRKVCAAIAYAHQNLVIHRDIKPANIRVTSDGEPKLLDFGIAKLLDPEAAAIAEQTMTLVGVMTPDYASPEQVRGENMTTASDVYSLGVVLYELLTEQKPYKIDNRTPTNVARAITEQEPTRPSAAIARGDGNSKTQNPSPKLLRGDLDNIVMMAMRKEVSRRYQSVGQFSEDIRRHLDGRPVIARKDTVGYRASKLIARNKVAVAAAALILLAIISGLIVSLSQAKSARRQRDVAQRERLKEERINTFLQDMLGAAAPEMKGIDVKVVDLLGEASRRAQAEATSQPDVMADVLMTLGRTYIALGLYDPAVADLRAAVDASMKANGELHPTTATSMGWLGLALSFQGKTKEGETISRKAVFLQRKLHPDGNTDLGVALYSLGSNLDAKTAEPLLQEASALIKKHLGENNGYYLATLTALGIAHEKLGDANGAESYYRRALEAGRGVERRYRIFLAQASAYLGMLLTNKQSYADAESALRESERVYRDVLGDSNSSSPAIQSSLGRLYCLKGDYAHSEIEYRKALELIPKYYPRDHFIMVGAMAGLGLTLTRANKPKEGERLLREALEIRKKSLPPGNVMIPYTESALGECLLVEKRYPEAETLLTNGYAGMKSTLGDQDPRVVEGRQRLGKLYEAWGKPEQAARYR
jgi:serine/threonine protein kinase/tetratricopeptide (TPR) repeat protein